MAFISDNVNFRTYDPERGLELFAALHAPNSTLAIIDETHVGKLIDSCNIIAFNRNCTNTKLRLFQLFLENGR
ncbi:hypothetical protein SAMN05518801_1309 [Novosphingobium sp. CF614]|nr:hypothetical protein SAMN05518801_1309 [Novosphingobium sp. CF614]